MISEFGVFSDNRSTSFTSEESNLVKFGYQTTSVYMNECQTFFLHGVLYDHVIVAVW